MLQIEKWNSKKYLMYGIYIIVLFFVLHRFYARTFSWIEQIVSCVAYPVVIVQNYTTQWTQKRLLTKNTLETLMHDNQKLREHNEQLLAENIALKATAVFADESAEVRQFKQRFAMGHAKLGQIILRNCTADGHFVLLDVGSRNGIAKDMIAIYKNCLVGKVTEVYPWYCKVTLITDKTCKVACYCVTTKATGIHQGQNELHSAELSFVNHLSTVAIGDTVLSSGEGLVFPQGFALGVVSDSYIEGLFHIVTVKPCLNLQEINYCYIIDKQMLISP